MSPEQVFRRPGEGEWAGRRVVVAGIGLSGFAAADALLERGASVTVVDERDQGLVQERGIILSTLTADVRLGAGTTDALPDVAGQSPDLVVASPGWRPEHPLLVAAAAAGIPIWGDVELAWQLRPADAAPWLAVSGSHGKTTTVRMLESMLRAGGHRAVAAGTLGHPLLEAVLHPQPYAFIAVELSALQLHWPTAMQPLASACLVVAPGAATEDLGRVYGDTEVACVYNVADPVTEQLVRDADVIEGCRAVGFTLGIPAVSMLGVVEDVLADRAFVASRTTSAAELGTLEDLRDSTGGVLAPHDVANALAAAALARAAGVGAGAVRAGLIAFVPEPHHTALVGERDGVRWVDDAAATDPHAADAALSAFERVVWVAGGPADLSGDLSGGAGVEDLVAAHAEQLSGVVLIGPGRGPIREALGRHAPDVPVVELDVPETGAMDDVVARAAELAHPGDVVLFAPGAPAAGLGDAFAAAVRSALGSSGPSGSSVPPEGS